MARQLRIDYPGAWHHVMNRGRRREDIFRTPEDRFEFLRLLAVVHDRFGIQVNAYALMGNHYHLLVHTPDAGLSQAMKHIDGVYAQGFNRRFEIDGPLFRGRFTSKLIDSDSYLGHVSDYIHRNPLALVGPKNLESYRWSSYPDFLASPRSRPAWLYSDALVASGIETPQQLRSRTTGAKDSSFDPSDFPQVIGEKDFVNAALARADADDQTIGHLRAGFARPSPKQIQAETLKVFSRESDVRLVEVGLCQELGGLTLSDIAERFGYRSAQSAGGATHRFRRRQEDEHWGLLVEKVRRGLEGLRVDERCR